MPYINVRSDLYDYCTCGHIRGEHLMPSGGWHAEYCLIVGCHCGRFQDRSGDESRRQPKRPNPDRTRQEGGPLLPT